MWLWYGIIQNFSKNTILRLLRLRIYYAEGCHLYNSKVERRSEPKDTLKEGRKVLQFTKRLEGKEEILAEKFVDVRDYIVSIINVK